MNYSLSKSSVFPVVEVSLTKNEVIKIERGAMVYHNSKISLDGKFNSNSGGIGGFVKALGRAAVSGESIFITQVTGLENDAKIVIAPSLPGAVQELKIGNQQWRINDRSFLACDSTVTYNMKRQSFGRAILGGTGGFFVMETSGSGIMLISAYGDILEVHLDGTTPMVFDNDHVVAWSTSLDYDIKIASGTFGFTTGEGIVNEFHGSGHVLIQTRNFASLAKGVASYIPNRD